MPTAPPEFSYDRDIAPQASRFFDEIGADTTLSHEAKMRLQGSLLGGVQGIESQRLKLQEERDQGRARKLDYEASSMRLEEARAARARAEQQEARRAGVTATAKSILGSEADDDTKRQMLALSALDHAGDDDAVKTFGLAEKVLPETPKSAISPAERYSAALKGIPQETIDDALRTGNLDLIAVAAADVEAQKDAEAEAKRLRHARGDDADRLKLELAKAPLKFQKDEMKGDTGWLEPESTQKATAIVLALGTPAEQARFDALKGADSDHARADLIEKIQLREQLRVAQATGGDGRKSAASVTGL